MNFEKMNNKELFDYCRLTGIKARTWKNRFLAALPEVARRRLYKKKGFCSIYEFAAKIGGISHNVVDECMRLDKKIYDKPKLKALIPEIGLNKVRIVAGIAKKETQDFWVEKVKLMTKSTLETYIKELRKSHPRMGSDLTANITHDNGQSTLFESKNLISSNADTSMGGQSVNSVSGSMRGSDGSAYDTEDGSKYHSNESACNARDESIYHSDDKSTSEKSAFTIRIDAETAFKLRKFKADIEKDRKEVVDWNIEMKELVKKAKGSSHRKNSSMKSAGSVATNYDKRKTKLRTVKKPLKQAGIRYVPVALRREITERYNGGCAFPGCNNLAAVLHHTKRFALQKNHDNLKPLCVKHHELAHQGLIEGEEGNPRYWRVKKYVDQKSPKYIVDRLTMRHKMALSSTN